MCTTNGQMCFGNIGICQNPTCQYSKECVIRTIEIDMKLEVRG